MSNNLYDITVNDKFTFNFDLDSIGDNDIIIPGEDESSYHLIKDGKSYNARVASVSLFKKEVQVIVDGKEFTVAISDFYDQLIEKLGLSIDVVHKINEVKAPMPGLVLQIEVAPGDAIQTGDPLLVLEAMKMENVIKAQGEGVVKSVLVEKGKAVEKGEILIEME